MDFNPTMLRKDTGKHRAVRLQFALDQWINNSFWAAPRVADWRAWTWVEQSEVHPSQKETVCRTSNRQHTFPFAMRQQVSAHRAWE
jgi:hypothetical protein